MTKTLELSAIPQAGVSVPQASRIATWGSYARRSARTIDISPARGGELPAMRAEPEFTCGT